MEHVTISATADTSFQPLPKHNDELRPITPSAAHHWPFRRRGIGTWSVFWFWVNPGDCTGSV